MINEFVPAGHFYSVIPNININYNNRNLKFNNLDYNDANHLEVLNEINDYLIDFDNLFGIKDTSKLNDSVIKRQNEFQYSLMNGNFEWFDARLLYYYIQKNKPKKIIEIGSGNSTLLMCNTKKYFNLDLEITCIEPYPSDYLRGLNSSKQITLIEDKLENVNLELFKSLSSNDILFIDSSHVLKLDSDVMYYFTKILPILNKNVLVHIHDIFFPYDYPLDWLKAGRFWNEQYFLYVFLQYNTKFKILFCNSYSEFKFNEKLKDIQKNSYEIQNNICNNAFSGGSIWLIVDE